MGWGTRSKLFACSPTTTSGSTTSKENANSLTHDFAKIEKKQQQQSHELEKLSVRRWEGPTRSDSDLFENPDSH